MTQLKILSAEDKLTEIRRLYFATSRQSIQSDLTRALDLLKSMDTEEERERATVYMEGLAEMARDWARTSAPKNARPAGAAGRNRPTPGAAATKRPGANTPGTGGRAVEGPARKPGGAKEKG
jgi:hypothetical protein